MANNNKSGRLFLVRCSVVEERYVARYPHNFIHKNITDKCKDDTETINIQVED